MPASLTHAQRLWGTGVLVAYLAYGVWGIILERRAERHRVRPAAGDDRWAPADFAPAGRRWAVLSSRWHRLRWAAWLGGVAALVLGGLALG